jgi:hypothetical protein
LNDDAMDPAPEPPPDTLRRDVLFLRAVVSILAELRSLEASASSPRVLFARDQVVVAICERISRISRGDQVASAGPIEAE